MTPDYKTFKSLSKEFTLIPTFEEMPVDQDTPVTIYHKLGESNEYSALLESVEGGEKFARYSFISISHHLKFESWGRDVALTDLKKNKIIRNTDPLLEMKKIFKELNPAVFSQLPRFCGGAVGMVSYDMVRNFEKLPNRLNVDPSIPDMIFLFTDECVIFDHWKHKLIIIKWNKVEKKDESSLLKTYKKAEKAHAALTKKLKTKTSSEYFKPHDPSKSFHKEVLSNFSRMNFSKVVDRTKEYIRAGDVIQTVLSQRFEMTTNADPFSIYRSLRIVNPSPYLFLLKLGEFSMAGSSPEILVRKDGQTAMTRPIAGTRKRGKSENEDLKLEKELLSDPKERAEHLMLVDLGRNDIGKCCKPGSMKVPNFMTVEKYSHVMHMVSTVEGTLKTGEDCFSLFKSCFPAGTVTGAPKVRAMEIIEELETVRRSIYAGSVGYFSYSGNMDMAITIRTILFKGGKLFMQAGAGIVADSIAKNEEQETRSKAQALFSAVEMTQKGLS